MGAQSVTRFTEAGYGDALSASPEVLKQERPVEDIKGWRSRSGMERSSFHTGRTSGPAELTDETANDAPRRSVVLRSAGTVKILHFDSTSSNRCRGSRRRLP